MVLQTIIGYALDNTSDFCVSQLESIRLVANIIRSLQPTFGAVSKTFFTEASSSLRITFAILTSSPSAKMKQISFQKTFLSKLRVLYYVSLISRDKALELNFLTLCKRISSTELKVASIYLVLSSSFTAKPIRRDFNFRKVRNIIDFYWMDW